MQRYSVIREKMPREFVLLQGTGCRWGKCSFCDYHTDTSDNPFLVNQTVLEKVTGEYGVLDVINSGSAMELDVQTINLIQRIVKEKGIDTVWFEAHYMYRHRLKGFAEQFPDAQVKFRCGVETFDSQLRSRWKKGIAPEVTAKDIARYFQGVCLLCCTQGEDFERIVADIETARQHFEYFSINLFCNNSTPIRRDEELVQRFVREIYPSIKDDPRIEVLANNTDLGVG